MNIEESSGTNNIRPPRFHCKMDFLFTRQDNATMDPPQTRREKKKDQREKGQGKNGKYSSKHIRQVEALKK